MSQRALELAYRYLNRRARTVSEVRRHLIAHEVEGGSAEAAIQELSAQGYLDDDRFAWLFTQDKRHLEQWGSERIRQALMARGIDPELAAAATSVEAHRADPAHADLTDPNPAADPAAAFLDPGSGELERALALLRRRFPDPPRDRRERERGLGLLLRKGYELELARDAVAAYARADG